MVSSDLYALGMVALQALGGLSVTDLQTLGDRESPQPEIPTSQKPLAAIVTKMIEYEPHKRYQSAREVLDDLEQV
jgi:serine/threonine protein kinase, bacterial